MTSNFFLTLESQGNVLEELPAPMKQLSDKRKMSYFDLLIRSTLHTCCLFALILSLTTLFSGISESSAEDVPVPATDVSQEASGPIRVQLGIEVNQIPEINQKAESFTVVGYLLLEWEDPEFSFDAVEAGAKEKFLNRKQFETLVAENALRWPIYIFQNQQGNRATQEETFLVRSDGKVLIVERFTVILQAPDFEFSKYPFDTQDFYIRIVSLPRDDKFVFEPHPDFNSMGDHLGMEAWSVGEPDVSISTYRFGLPGKHSQYLFHFKAARHINYYILRIFVPMFLIITVSWVTFFMKDYAKRVDVSTANLLTFVAFNFTFGSELPRLGYLTFMDLLLVISFIITAFTVVCNVIIKRLDSSNQDALCQKIDTFFTWGYPIVYIGSLLVMVFYWLY